MKKLLLALALLLVAAPAHAQFNQRAAVSAATQGDNTIIASASGKQTYIYGFDLALASSTTVTLKCGSTALTGAMTLTSYMKPLSSGSPYWVCPDGAAFVITLGGAVQTSGAIWYSQQ